ncbi:hypothetical protein ACQI4F_03850 [Mycolicibacterium vaccae]|uniref:hypothetical protein n=1 Tax=Mycolicibacterium vaccae TaxID=1810 RepID=UPI003CEB1379
MNAIATKIKVSTAAVAMAATAAFAPVAANAAPAVQVPAAPAVQQVVGQLPEAPGDFLFYTQVASLQVVASIIRFRSFSLESRAQRLQAYANLNPNTFFGRLAAQTAERLITRRNALGQISFSACRDGRGISVGPYGTVTGGAC